MKFEDSSNYCPTINDAALVFFSMTLKWYKKYGNLSENDLSVTKGKILINTSNESKVLGVKVIFQAGFSLQFGRNEPELLQIFQTFLVQRIWDISYNENSFVSDVPDLLGLENPFP